MTAPRSLLSLILTAGFGLFLAGCGRGRTPVPSPRESHPSEHAASLAVGITFHSKKGLFVPAESARFLGLRLTELEEKRIDPSLQFRARVYRTSNETGTAADSFPIGPGALVSGTVAPHEAAQLREGQTISAESVSGENRLPGRIIALRRDLEVACGRVEVLVAVSDGTVPLAPGAFVTITVPLAADASSIAIPRSALLRTVEGDFIYTKSGEHFVRAPIVLGTTDQELIEVREGLYPGDVIVVAPVMSLWMAELQALRGGKACADGH